LGYVYPVSNEARDQDRAVAVFREVVTLLGGEFDYAIGGGLSTDHWTGGTKWIGDIDVVIREEDGPDILELLSTAGYEAIEMEHSWLHKAMKDGVTIDLMFELKNGTTFDDEFKSHRRKGEMFGTTCFIMAPEDQVPSLAGTVDRGTIGQHWYGMLDIMSNNDLDWDYLLTRVERVPLQMLSVVYYALSVRTPIPKGVIEHLEGLARESEPV
jgi:hypothetical protein